MKKRLLSITSILQTNQKKRKKDNLHYLQDSSIVYKRESPTWWEVPRVIPPHAT